MCQKKEEETLIGSPSVKAHKRKQNRNNNNVKSRTKKTEVLDENNNYKGKNNCYFNKIIHIIHNSEYTEN